MKHSTKLELMMAIAAIVILCFCLQQLSAAAPAMSCKKDKKQTIKCITPLTILADRF
jgi:hypothetical protein